MGKSFREFLLEEQKKQEVIDTKNQAIIQEWRAAITELFGQIRGWLSEADPNGIITVEEAESDVTEAGLGHYKAPRLELHAFGKWIGILPKARHTVATARPPQKGAPERATGRVDITDEVQRFVLYRFSDEGKPDVWMIDDLRSDQKPLTQEAFEEALKRYLQ